MLGLTDRTWLWIGAAFYAAAFVTVTWSMLEKQTRSKKTLLVLIVLGLVAQTLGLQHRGVQTGGCPLGNKLEVAQFVIWSFTVIYLIVGPAFRVSLLGYFTSGLATLMSVTSLLIPAWDGPRQPPAFGGNPWIEMHASLALLAYGVFGTLALTSLMFLLQTFSLKRKYLRGLFGLLPPIVALEGINFRLLLTGIAVLTISIGLGVHYYLTDRDSIALAKLLIATAVWVAYLIALGLRLSHRLVSNGLAWVCLALFVLALLSLNPIIAGLKGRPPPTALPPSALSN